MAELLAAKPYVEKTTAELAERAEALKAAGITPTLAILRVGERPDDVSYERGATKRCAASGVEVRNFVLDAECSQEELMAAIGDINADAGIHGCLMLRPLPKTLDEKAACGALDPAKDVDCITPGSLYGVFACEDTGFPPCTAQACLETLDFYGIDVAGKHVVVIGRSLVIGKPVSMMLQARNATVTMCHSRSNDLPGICRGADVLVVAVGRAKMVDAGYVAQGQTVIDVGINWDSDAGKLVGDVDFDAVEPVAGAITPVPGGLGSVTSTVLAKHVIEATERMG